MVTSSGALLLRLSRFLCLVLNELVQQSQGTDECVKERSRKVKTFFHVTIPIVLGSIFVV